MPCRSSDFKLSRVNCSCAPISSLALRKILFSFSWLALQILSWNALLAKTSNQNNQWNFCTVEQKDSIFLSSLKYVFWNKTARSYFRKKQTGRVEDILFWKPSLKNLLYHWKFQIKQSPTIHYISWGKKGQKPRPLEIPNDFFLITPRNFSWFLIDHWKFHMLLHVISLIPLEIPYP